MCLSIKYKAQCLKHHPERMSLSVKKACVTMLETLLACKYLITCVCLK